jgi:hypothetical protein
MRAGSKKKNQKMQKKTRVYVKVVGGGSGGAL